MKLLITQKNELYDLITAFGLSPSQFKLTEARSEMSEGQVATVLQLTNTKFHFIIETFNSDNPYLYYSPGDGKYASENHADGWNEVISYLHIWLNALTQEITAEDKWARLETEVKALKIKIDNEQDKFSAHEFEQLKSQIYLLKDGIRRIGLSDSQVQTINEKLDHLTSLATEMNKFDWKSLFIGTIVSMIIQLSVTPDNASSLWKLIKQVFNNYFLP
jgi:hypothetical protein